MVATVENLVNTIIFLILFGLVLALLVWSTQQSFIEITALVTAHNLHYPHACMKKLAFFNYDGASTGVCWGAHISFVYPWKATSRNCTLLVATPPEVHTAGKVMLESYPMESAHTMYCYYINDECTLEVPKTAPIFVYLPIYLIFVIGVVYNIHTIATILWEWYGTHIRAWCYRWGLLAGGEAGDEDKMADNLPLVASAAPP